MIFSNLCTVSQESESKQGKQVKPITPREVGEEQARVFPDQVVEAFNELIAQSFTEGYATILQKDAVKLMVEKGLNKKDIFDKGWLNIEDMYRKVGWDVEYDKPGYDESYEPAFKFSKKRSSRR